MDQPLDKRDNGSVQQYENAPRSKRQGLKNHVKRFWWLHLLVILAIIVLSVCLIIFVGVKNIAQGKINKATLSVQGISVTNTTEDTFIMSINSTLKSGTTKATVDAFNGSMYLEDFPDHHPFVILKFPQTENMPSQSINITQNIKIANRTALTTFNTWLLRNNTVRVTVEGDTHVKVRGISHRYPIHFKKTITLNGFQGFDGIKFENSSITIQPAADGSNFHSTAWIPNRSVMTLDAGNITFATFLGDAAVGFSYLDNIVILPGNHSYPIHSKIDQTHSINGVTTQPYCGNGTLPFLLSGRESINNGQKLTYFSDALASYNTTAWIDLDTPLRKLGLNPKCP